MRPAGSLTLAIGLKINPYEYRCLANNHTAFTQQRTLVREHRSFAKAAFRNKCASAKRGSRLTPSLFYTGPITVTLTSAGASPARGPAAGLGPCGQAASGSGA